MKPRHRGHPITEQALQARLLHAFGSALRDLCLVELAIDLANRVSEYRIQAPEVGRLALG